MADKTDAKQGPEKPKQEKKVFKPQQTGPKMTGKESKDFRGIVRVIGKDIDGHMKVTAALMQVKGIGHNLAETLSRAIKAELGIDVSTQIGELTEEQIEKIENLAKGADKRVYKAFLLNRPRDVEVGDAKHLLGNELAFQIRQDIQREKDTRSYRGWRHSLGQKVRGQHNRTTGRSGLTVGVVKKTLQQAAAPAAKEEKKK